MRNFIKRKRTLVAIGGVALLIAAGGAYAYWTTSGGGSGTATTGTDSGVTVTQVGSIAALVPGGTAQAVDFKINNPIATKQYVTGVSFSIASVESSPGTPAVGCSATDFTLVQPTAIAADLTSGDHTYSPSGATLALKDLSTNQDGCKSVTVNLTFAAV